MNYEEQDAKDRLSLGLSLFIALCVIALFCAISVAITRHMEMDESELEEYYSLSNNDNTSEQLFF